MGWWFGRKSAADPRPFVPAWLGTGEQTGFARSTDGLSVFVKSNGMTLRFEGGTWKQILGSQQPVIPDAAGGTVVDLEARAAIAAMLAALRSHSLIAP